MSELFLYLFLLLCVGLILKVVSEPELIYEYPYFTAFVFLIFIAPQALIIYNQPRLIPPGTSAALYAACFLCTAMAYIGYKHAPSISIGKVFSVPLDEKKVFNIAVIYTFLGYLFLFLIRSRLSEMKNVETQWSGVLTIYVQLFHFINIAFPILLYYTLRNFSVKYLVWTIISALPSAYFIIAAGRREVTALFLLTFALAFFFRFRLKPSKGLIIGAVVFAMLIIPATGDYRMVAKDKGPMEAIKSLDLKQSFTNYFENGKYLELAVAGHIIDSYKFHGEFAYGAGYWDNMVFRYVPGQITGQDFKQSLMINREGTKFKNGYQAYTGLTPTGVGDSFIQFGFLGCLFFFFVAGFFRELFRSSTSGDKPLVQVLYLMSMVQGLLVVTHQTINFLPGIFFSIVCLWLIAMFGRESDPA